MTAMRTMGTRGWRHRAACSLFLAGLLTLAPASAALAAAATASQADCARPALGSQTFCASPKAALYRTDCDGDGLADWACAITFIDTNSQYTTLFKVALSGLGCQAPHEPRAPMAYGTLADVYRDTYADCRPAFVAASQDGCPVVDGFVALRDRTVVIDSARYLPPRKHLNELLPLLVATAFADAGDAIRRAGAACVEDPDCQAFNGRGYLFFPSLADVASGRFDVRASEPQFGLCLYAKAGSGIVEASAGAVAEQSGSSGGDDGSTGASSAAGGSAGSSSGSSSGNGAGNGSGSGSTGSSMSGSGTSSNKKAADCPRPEVSGAPFCSARGQTAYHLDCDGDGRKDWACLATDLRRGSKGYMRSMVHAASLSGKQCPSGAKALALAQANPGACTPAFQPADCPPVSDAVLDVIVKKGATFLPADDEDRVRGTALVHVSEVTPPNTYYESLQGLVTTAKAACIDYMDWQMRQCVGFTSTGWLLVHPPSYPAHGAGSEEEPHYQVVSQPGTCLYTVGVKEGGAGGNAGAEEQGGKEVAKAAQQRPQRRLRGGRRMAA